ncbi:hypothetical protein C8Q79DRAFT_1009684 [Trametes meyenii]|nr:hypothetical protein C8Q79DRAFT_1009684 [Trametes meyenii]
MADFGPYGYTRRLHHYEGHWVWRVDPTTAINLSHRLRVWYHTCHHAHVCSALTTDDLRTTNEPWVNAYPVADASPEDDAIRREEELIDMRCREYEQRLPPLPISYTGKIFQVVKSIRTRARPLPKLHYGFLLTPEEIKAVTQPGDEDEVIFDAEAITQHLNNKLQEMEIDDADCPLFSVEFATSENPGCRVLVLYTTESVVRNLPDDLFIEWHDVGVKLFKEIITDQREVMWHFDEKYGQGNHKWREFDPVRVLGLLAPIVAEYEAERAAQAVPL